MSLRPRADPELLSRVMSSIGTPLIPPVSLMSSTASNMACSRLRPNADSLPVNGRDAPMRIVSPCDCVSVLVHPAQANQATTKLQTNPAERRNVEEHRCGVRGSESPLGLPTIMQLSTTYAGRLFMGE